MDTRASGIEKGMIVRTSDGHKLGKVAELEPQSFIIEKGVFFPKEYVAAFGEIKEVREGEIWLHKSKDQLGAEHPVEPTAGPTARMGTAHEEQRIPLVEEELQATTRSREVGQVRVSKDVTTEQREISVPVTKEQVRVERVPAGTHAAEPGAGAFREGTVTVPIHEEEVEIRKRPVVKEELRISKDRATEERRASETVRKETADIEEEGQVKRRDEELPGGYTEP